MKFTDYLFSKSKKEGKCQAERELRHFEEEKCVANERDASLIADNKKGEPLSTKVTRQDREEAYVDENSVKFSPDLKRLVKVPSYMCSYTVPDSVTVICDYAFSPFWGATSEMPLEEDGRELFYLSSHLTSVTFPEGVARIGYCAFEGCNRLISVTFPKNLTTIEESAFEGCCSLTSVTFPKGLTTIERCAFHECSSLKSVTFPNGLITLEGWAFCECSSLTSVTFSEGITTVGIKAFAGCESLTSVTLPKGLKTIGHGAFFGCKSLKASVRNELLRRFGKIVFADIPF